MGRAHAQFGNNADADRCYGNALALFADAGPGAAADREAVLRLRDELGDTATHGSHVDTTSAEHENTEGNTSE